MKKRLPAVILTALAMVLAIVAVALSKSEKYMAILGNPSNIIVLCLAVLAGASYITLSLLKVNKMLLIAPFIVGLAISEIYFGTVVSGLAEISSGSSTLTDSTLLSLLTLAATIVGMVFALKGHKWGAILAMVFFGLEIYSLLSIILVTINAAAFDAVTCAFAALLLMYVGFVLTCTEVFYKKEQPKVEQAEQE